MHNKKLKNLITTTQHRFYLILYSPECTCRKTEFNKTNKNRDIFFFFANVLLTLRIRIHLYPL